MLREAGRFGEKLWVMWVRTTAGVKRIDGPGSVGWWSEIVSFPRTEAIFWRVHFWLTMNCYD